MYRLPSFDVPSAHSKQTGSASYAVSFLRRFSRCLKIVDAAGGMPRVFRDLLLTGALFERRLDADGPFVNSCCRLNDLANSNPDGDAQRICGSSRLPSYGASAISAGHRPVFK
jgi:hypothetical protein